MSKKDLLKNIKIVKKEKDDIVFFKASVNFIIGEAHDSSHFDYINEDSIKSHLKDKLIRHIYSNINSDLCALWLEANKIDNERIKEIVVNILNKTGEPVSASND